MNEVDALTATLRPLHWSWPAGHAWAVVGLVGCLLALVWSLRWGPLQRWWRCMCSLTVLWLWWGGMRCRGLAWEEAAHARACDRHLRLQWRRRWPDAQARRWSQTVTGSAWHRALVQSGQASDADAQVLSALLSRGCQPQAPLDPHLARRRLAVVARWVRGVWA